MPCLVQGCALQGILVAHHGPADGGSLKSARMCENSRRLSDRLSSETGTDSSQRSADAACSAMGRHAACRQP